MDLPHGVSKVFPLGTIYDNEMIRGAVYGGDDDKLTLPGEVLGELTRWRRAQTERLDMQSLSEDFPVIVRWEDPVHAMERQLAIHGLGMAGDIVRTSRPQLGACPFQLPKHFREWPGSVVGVPNLQPKLTATQSR